MHLDRIPQFEIAERLKITEAMVSRDLKAIREEWRAEARSDVGEATERELKSLAASERRLRSEIEKIKPGANIALLCKLSAEIVRIQTHRARLLGLEAPTKLVHQGPDGKPIQHDVTARAPDAATLDEERALRALTPEARRAVLARARAEVEGAARAIAAGPDDTIDKGGSDSRSLTEAEGDGSAVQLRGQGSGEPMGPAGTADSATAESVAGATDTGGA